MTETSQQPLLLVLFRKCWTVGVVQHCSQQLSTSPPSSHLVVVTETSQQPLLLVLFRKRWTVGVVQHCSQQLSTSPPSSHLGCCDRDQSTAPTPCTVQEMLDSWCCPALQPTAFNFTTGHLLTPGEKMEVVCCCTGPAPVQHFLLLVTGSGKLDSWCCSSTAANSFQLHHHLLT